MKIALIGQKGIPAHYGGVETHVHELAMGLVARGVQVTAYARPWYTQTTTAQVDGVPVRYIASIHSKHLDTATHTFLSTIDAIKQQFDVIHYHGVGPSLFAWIPRLFAPHITIISTFHTLDRKNEKWGLFARFCLRLGEWAACRFAHKTIAVSQTLQQYIRDVYDIDAAYIPNSVPEYTKTKETNHLTEWNLQPQKYFLFVARLIPLKGAHYLIAAYLTLKKERPELIAGKKLVIVGDAAYTDKYVRKLKALAKEDSDIIFTGFRTGKTLAQLYSHAYALIHPSDYEGLSLTVLEAMSYGLPLIVSDIPEHRELIPNSDRRFSHGNVLSLQTRMTQLMETSEEAIAKDVAQNKRMIEKNFNASVCIDRVKQLYEDIYSKEQEKNPRRVTARI